MTQRLRRLGEQMKHTHLHTHAYRHTHVHMPECRPPPQSCTHTCTGMNVPLFTQCCIHIRVCAHTQGSKQNHLASSRISKGWKLGQNVVNPKPFKNRPSKRWIAVPAPSLHASLTLSDQNWAPVSSVHMSLHLWFPAAPWPPCPHPPFLAKLSGV
jgi:hypothetical protein